MLKSTRTVTLIGVSEIEGQQAVYMTSTMSTDGGNATVNKTITNRELYNTNRAACRTDVLAFETQVYALEDELYGGAVV